MSNNHTLWTCLILALMLFPVARSVASEPTDFVVSCNDVDSIMVELAYDLESFERRVIGCQVELTSVAGMRLDEHCAKWFGDMFPITAKGKVITIYDSTTRSIPPQFVFMEETWNDAKRKLMAICPEKIPEIPQRVLDHQKRGHLTN